MHREKGLFLSVKVDDIKLDGKKQIVDPMWKVLTKEVDLGEPTSFFDHVYLGCAQRECKISKDIIDNYRDSFESRIPAGGIENRCLLTVGQKRKLKSTTHSPWKTIPMKQPLKKGDDDKRN